MVGQILKELVEEKDDVWPWMEEGTWNLLAQIGSCVMLWILSTTNVLALLGGNNWDGYGVVCKVWIERFDHIPSTIELVGKTLKMDDKQKTHKIQSVETLACPCEHANVIKFLTIHIETTKAYTLWWNGGTLWEMLDYNMKYSPIIDNHTLLWQGGLDMEGQTWFVAFKWNCMNLAWAFLNIMNVVHHYGILYNDLKSKDNITFHFLINKLDVVYI
jgi:hypothetical protein